MAAINVIEDVQPASIPRLETVSFILLVPDWLFILTREAPNIAQRNRLFPERDNFSTFLTPQENAGQTAPNNKTYLSAAHQVHNAAATRLRERRTLPINSLVLCRINPIQHEKCHRCYLSDKSRNFFLQSPNLVLQTTSAKQTLQTLVCQQRASLPPTASVPLHRGSSSSFLPNPVPQLPHT